MPNFLTSFFSLLSLLFLGHHKLNAQDNYRTIGSGNWSSTSIWEKDNNGNGIFIAAGAVPTTSDGNITIRSGDNVVISSPVSIDQTIINQGGTISVASGQTLTVLNGSGDDLTVDGTLLNNGSITIGNLPISAIVRVNGSFSNNGSIFNSSSTSVFFESGSSYIHLFTATAGLIPLASWNQNSSCIISGYTTNEILPSGINQVFGNFIWNTPNLNIVSDVFNLQGFPTIISGSFKVYNTGNNALALNAQNSNLSITINDSLVIANGAILTLNYHPNSKTNAFVKHFLIQNSSSSFILGADGNGELIVNNTFNYSSGSITPGAGLTNTRITFKNNNGNVTYNGDQVINDPVKFTVDTNTTLTILANSFISTTDSLQLRNNSALRLLSTSATGAYLNTVLGGNVRTPVTLRSFATGTKLIFNGNGAQFVGANTFPSNVELVVRNQFGLSLNTNTTILGTLNLDSGFINLTASQILTLGNSTAIKGNLIINKGYLSGDGTFRRWFDNTTNVLIGTNNGLFPFGLPNDTARFLWIEGLPTTGGTVSVRHIATTGTSNITPSFMDASLSIDRRNNCNWIVSVGNGFAGTNFSLRLRAGKNGGVNNLSALRVSLSNSIGPGVNQNASGTLQEPEANRGGLTSTQLNNTFYFATSSSLNPLSVKFIDVHIKQIQNSLVEIKWTLANQLNIRSYHIEISDDNINWKELSAIPSNNLTGTITYKYQTNNYLIRNLLRIKAVDLNGSHFYSGTASVINDYLSDVTIYPNPVNKEQMISIQSEFEIENWELLNLNGKSILTSKRINEKIINLADQNLFGIYFLRVQSENNVTNHKLIFN